MSQSGYTPIQLYRTATTATAPSAGDLTDGELAINYNTADMALYAKNSAGSVKSLINNPAGLKYPTADGTSNQVIKTDGSGNLSFTTASSMTYPGAGIAVSTGSAWTTSLTAPSGTVVGTSDTQTLTNKRVTPRVNASTANSATPTLNTDSYDMMVITGQSVAITSFTTNLTGTPTNGQKLWIAITGTGAIAITWGASFESSTIALPTTTVTTARLDIGFVWNAATSKWRCVATA